MSSRNSLSIPSLSRRMTELMKASKDNLSGIYEIFSSGLPIELHFQSIIHINDPCLFFQSIKCSCQIISISTDYTSIIFTSNKVPVLGPPTIGSGCSLDISSLSGILYQYDTRNGPTLQHDLFEVVISSPLSLPL